MEGLKPLQQEASTAPVPHTPGAYVLRHPASGRSLVGAAPDLVRRRKSHLDLLDAGLHPCRELQAAYDEDANLQFEFYATPTIEEARVAEREFTAEAQPSGKLFAASPRCKQGPFKPRTTYHA